MKPITRFVMAAFAVTTLIPVTAMAASQDSKNQGYLVDNTGGSIITSGTGLCWRDSDWTPARGQEPCDPTAKPVAVLAPVPAPAIVAVVEPTPAAKVLPQKISFSGDALFAFNKSELKPEGKTMLDGLVQQLNGAATYDTIVATGHTDRFGSNGYNQKLSERRAHAVKDYLVSKNIQASRVDAEGKGETQPVTKVGDCQGAHNTKVVACLQPDRRVDIEMKGTKITTGSL
ncbi:MAG: OmpA family protein [Pseudomonadota bacterium]